MEKWSAIFHKNYWYPSHSAIPYVVLRRNVQHQQVFWWASRLKNPSGPANAAELFLSELPNLFQYHQDPPSITKQICRFHWCSLLLETLISYSHQNCWSLPMFVPPMGSYGFVWKYATICYHKVPLHPLVYHHFSTKKNSNKTHMGKLIHHESWYIPNSMDFLDASTKLWWPIPMMKSTVVRYGAMVLPEKRITAL